jgi:hypothetical protein
MAEQAADERPRRRGWRVRVGPPLTADVLLYWAVWAAVAASAAV